MHWGRNQPNLPLGSAGHFGQQEVNVSSADKICINNSSSNLKLVSNLCVPVIMTKGNQTPKPGFMRQQTQNKCIFQSARRSVCEPFAQRLPRRFHCVLVHKSGGESFFRVCTKVPTCNSRSTKCRGSCMQKLPGQLNVQVKGFQAC